MAQTVWGPASSELGWKGFADGAKMGSPAAIAPPKNDIYKKLAVKAITDIGGAAWNEYTSPVDTGTDMWGEEIARFDTAIEAQTTPEAREAARRAKGDFIRSHPTAGKAIVARPEWAQKAPRFLMEDYQTPEGTIRQSDVAGLKKDWRAPEGFAPTRAPAAPITEPSPTFDAPDISFTPTKVKKAEDALIKFDQSKKGKTLTNKERGERQTLVEDATAPITKINAYLEGRQKGQNFSKYARKIGAFHPDDRRSSMPWNWQLMQLKNMSINPSDEFMSRKGN